MRNFIARQPVFDMHMDVYAYELLYRHDDINNFFNEDVGEDQASSETIMESFQGMGIEKITNGRRAFVNFTFNLIEQDVATLFPKEFLIIEVLENVAPSPSVVQKIRNLKQMGYMIALDDFAAYSPDFRELIELADIIKIDFLQLTLPAITEIVSCFDLTRVKLLAEKVETLESYEAAKELGFTLFQGFFFSKPVIISGRRMDPLKINYIPLVRRVNQEELDFPRLAKVIRRDVALSYKMLKLVNSSSYGQRGEIKDIQDALVLLGEEEIRKWISRVAMTGCGDGKPDELIHESMIRARFMEVFGTQYGMAQDVEVLFLTGLFSLIDAVMELPMKEVMASLCVPEVVEEALVYGRGKAADLLRVFCAYEQGDWEESAKLCEAFNVPGGRLPELYVDAVRWCDEMMI